MKEPSQQRRLSIGAELLSQGGAHFRVWASRRQRVEVALEGNAEQAAAPFFFELSEEQDGYFGGQIQTAHAGTLYRYRLDGGPELFPDPASRFQPFGPHGPSQVVESERFPWTDQTWRGVTLENQVIYEMHIGTFTPEGTWEAAARQLTTLAADGVTILEVMPVADFPGRFGWGYDGVNLYAPTHVYGSPDEFRSFVDAAHTAGLGVILDVVYNHLGPDGNYLSQFSGDYFTDRYENAWGQAINFDGHNCGPVREFFVANASYWIREFHLDGLRLDATHQIFDRSPRHILVEISRRVRESAGGRNTLVIAEHELRDATLVRSEADGGYGLDALWSDDWHHSAHVAMTGRREFFYADFSGTAQELLSATKWGFLYQGQRSSTRPVCRGTPALDLAPMRFINFLENHDQIAHSARGWRIHKLTSPGRFRALTALLLLAPQTPLLFQGQEFAASSPFLYFADHQEELSKLVRRGRFEFLASFRSLSLPEMQAVLPDPASLKTFQQCKLDFGERETHAGIYQMHRDLLRLRREDRALQLGQRGRLDGAVLGPHAFLVRFFTDNGDDRLLIVNLGADLDLLTTAEPLLAPPARTSQWSIFWSTENPAYGGSGTPPLDAASPLQLPGEAAVLLLPQ